MGKPILILRFLTPELEKKNVECAKNNLNFHFPNIIKLWSLAYFSGINSIVIKASVFVNVIFSGLC